MQQLSLSAFDITYLGQLLLRRAFAAAGSCERNLCGSKNSFEKMSTIKVIRRVQARATAVYAHVRNVRNRPKDRTPYCLSNRCMNVPKTKASA